MENNKNLKKKTVTGFIWAYGERFVAYAIHMVVSIILARLIAPDQYGIVSIVTVMIMLADIFVSSGFGSSLVQKKDTDENDFNTAFTCGFWVSCVLYIILFLSAPYAAMFFGMKELCNVIRVMALRLPIASVNTIQHARIQKSMEFKKFFFSTLTGTLISAIVGIVLALNGFKVWALVAQYLTNAVIDTIMLMITGKWHPKFYFSVMKAKDIMGFGWKVLMQRLTFTLTGNVQTLVIGKHFSAQDLAFYDNGVKIPQAILSNVYETVGKVMFPALSSIQDEYEKKKLMIRQSVRVCTFLLSPIAIGLMVTAEPMVVLLYTPKWIPCVPFLQICCLRFLPRPLTTIAQQSILAAGRSDIVLKIEIILNASLIITLCIATFIYDSVIMIAWGSLIAVAIGIILNAIAVNKLLNYTYREQMQDTASSYISGILMGIVVYSEKFIFNENILKLVIQCITGVMLYVLFSCINNKELVLGIKKLMLGVKR